MAVTTTYPGVYIQEIPSGVRTITGVATSITAFVGYTARGPVNRAVRIHNFGDYEREFGGLHRDSAVAYALQQFFLNGATDAYVVRVARGANLAAVTLKFGAGAADDALIVNAADPGDWGNDVRVDVDYATSNPDSTFNLKVTRLTRQGGTLVPAKKEEHRNLSMNSRSSTYVRNVINSASELIRVQSAAGLAFADRGYTLSRLLSLFPLLNAPPLDTLTTLSGILDGADPFTLVLTPPRPANMANLLARVNAAIADANLGARIQANRADALGRNTAGGDYLKLTSRLVAADPNTADEHSSIQITPSPANDLAPILGFGVYNGGREKEGASSRRPLPTGTLSADLADLFGANVNGNLEVLVRNNAPPAAIILPVTTVALPATPLDSSFPPVLEALLQTIPNAATRQATVKLFGTFLCVQPTADTPNASIEFTDAFATTLRLRAADGASINVQHYGLGRGAIFGGQTAISAGADGTPPGAAEILGNFGNKTGIYALRDVDLFNLLAIPETAGLPDPADKSVIAAAVRFCSDRRAFYLIDPDPTRTAATIAAWAAAADSSKHSAVFFPRVRVADPLDGFRLREVAASGAVAGVFARTDSERGVWKAPAGTAATLSGIRELTVTLTDQENGVLNPLGINCLRSFPVYGRVVWGSRTREGADAQASEWKYIPIRRLALMIEESLYRGTQWVVFEPNDEPLWAQIRLNVGAFMHDLFRRGAFQGKSPREAYFVKCDGETTTQTDRNLGIVNILVGFAPLKPAEFVVITIQQIAGEIQT
jgi:phage tail sheath protein FI